MVDRSTSGSPSVLAVILAGGRGSRLHDLTDVQAKPALPLGAAGRLIDFTLANVVHSGIKGSLVLTQYLPDTLHDHLEKRWRPIRDQYGLSLDVINGADKGLFSGTADAVAKVSAEIDFAAPTHVVILAGDHLYQMDYGPFIERHIQSRAQVTVGAVQVPVVQAHEFGVMTVEPDGRIAEFLEKPAHPSGMAARPGFALASMGIYVFDWRLLRKWLKAMAPLEAELDFGRHVLPHLVHSGTAYAFELPGRGQAAPLWRDLGTLDAYHAIHADLENDRIPLDPTWPLLVGRPRQPVLRAALFSSAGAADGPRRGWTGCSVGEGARIGSHCELINVVVQPGAWVGNDVRIENAIIASDAIVPDGFDLEEALAAAEAWCTISEGGIRVISERALVALADLAPKCWRQWASGSTITYRSRAGNGRGQARLMSKVAEIQMPLEEE